MTTPTPNEQTGTETTPTPDTTPDTTPAQSVIISGIGPNGITIPLLVFGNREAAMKYLNDAGSERGEIPKAVQKNRSGKEARDFWAKFTTSYYDGCGEIGYLSVEIVPHGVPFIDWSLD